MNKLLLKYIFAVTILIGCIANCGRAFGQVLLNDDFEDGSITTSPAWSGNTSNFLPTSAVPVLAGTNSLRSSTGAANKSINLSYSATLTSSTTIWRMLYRNNSLSDPANITTAPASGSASWRYWLIASSTNTTTASGYALIHQGNKLVIVRMLAGLEINSIIVSYTFGAGNYGNTFSIKVTRSPAGLWSLYVNTGTAEPTTLASTGTENVYTTGGTVNTILEACDNNSANRFVWDNIKVSQPLLTVGANTNSVTPSSTIIYPNSGSYPIFSFQLTAIEDISLDYLDIATNQSMTGVFSTGTVKIYRSTDNIYDAGDVDITTLAGSWGNGTINAGYIRFNNGSGVTIADGSNYYYFIVAATATSYASYPTPVTLNANSTTTLGSQVGSFVAHSNTGFNVNAYNNSSATPLTFGAYKDWVGNNSTDFNSAGNWSPSGLPTATDAVRIGIATYNRQPSLTASISIGALILGTIQNTTNSPFSYPTLTVNFPLTIAGSITQNSNWTASGASTNTVSTILGSSTITAQNLNIGDGSTPALTTGASAGLYASMTGSITLSGNINVVSSVNSGGGQGPGAFFLGSGTLTCAGVVTNTTAGGIASFYLDQSTVIPGVGTLNLTGSTPFTLGAGTSYFNLGGGSASGTTNVTVNYSAAGAQSIILNLPKPGGGNTYYDNLIFSGSGTKSFSTTGTLKLDGNLTTSGTPTVDLTVNNPTISVTGAVTNGSGCTILQGSNPFTITGALTNTGTFTGGGGTLSAGSVALTGGTFSTAGGAFSTTGNFIASGSSIINFGSGTVGIGGFVQLQPATLNFGASTATFTNAVQFQPGTVTCNSAGTVNFNSSVQNSLTSTFAGAGTINFNGSFINAASFTPGTGTVTFKGAYTNSSTFNYSAGTIIFNNASTSATQALADNSTGGTNLNNVTFTGASSAAAAAISMSGTGKFNVASTGILTIGNGTTQLIGGGVLTLNSGASSSASVAVIPSGSSITGNVNVQRFITGGAIAYRGYRLLSSPVHDAATTFFNFAYLKGTGTGGSGSYLTGNGGSTHGFDAGGNATLYLYRQDMLPSNSSFTTGNFRPVTIINNSPNAYNVGTQDGAVNMPIGNGFLYFYRGNNGIVTTTIPSSLTFTTTGTLNQGNITVSPWFYQLSTASFSGPNTLSYSTTSGTTTVEGFNLVGNPYPSSIDWNTAFSGTGIIATGTDKTVYIYNVSNKNYATYQTTSTSAGTAQNGGSSIIPSGQGFFVHTNAATGAVLTFTEAAKVSSQPPALFLNAAAPIITRELRFQLSKDSINTDETVLVFSNTAHTDYIQNEDALYLKGSGAVSLSNMSTNKVALAINRLPFPAQSQTIPLNIAVTATGAYQLNMTEAANIPDVYDTWLMDTYKKDSLDVKHNPVYSFAVSGDTASTGSNRFKLVIRQNPALAVHLLSFDAIKNTTQVNLTWTAEHEANYTRYLLQRSTDGGKTFIVLDSLTSVGLGTYTDLDQKPVTGLNQYRLEQIDLIGNVSYSNMINIMYSAAGNNIANNIISVYPNPVSSIINLNINPTSATPASYKITVTNSSGIIVNSSTSNQPTWQGDVSGLTPGTYFIQVTNTKNNSLTGRSTFVKL